MAGIVLVSSPAARIRLQGRLPELQPGLWVDHDACWLGQSQLLSASDWQAALPRLHQVRGAYVLVNWDGERLLLARDPVGERTLYYTQGPHPAFASRLKDLPHTGQLDALGLGYYLCCAYIPGQPTLIQGVQELLPGEQLEFRAGEFRRLSLWEPPADELQEPEDVLRQSLRSRLEEAVERRLAEGPLGCTLSGGIDSSLVVALAARRRPLHTYSLSFGPDYANELPFSSAVAQHCHTRHRVVELSPAQVVQRLDEVLGWLSKPNGDPLTIPNAMLFQEAAREVAIVLNGEGGDPCFGGPKNLPMLLSELYGDGDREGSFLRSHLKCYDDLEEMLCPDLWDILRDRALERDLEPVLRAPGTSLIQKLMRINLRFKGAHHILPKVEAISYPFGVLARSPLFDQEVVELASRLPPQLKLKGSTEKYLLKEAVRDLLPAAVVDRPKSGMMVPVEAWFSGPLLAEARSRLLDGLAPRGLIRRDYLERLLDGQLGGLRPRRGVKIWLLITLECWLRAHLP